MSDQERANGAEVSPPFERRAADEIGNGVRRAGNESGGREDAPQELESEASGRANADARPSADADVAPDAVSLDRADIVDQPVAPRASAELQAIVEALIFASPEPLTKKVLARLLASEPWEDVEAALDALKCQYERPGGLHLVEVAGGYQIVTRPDLHEWVRQLFHQRATQKLSAQALETLAVIAYRQPVTALEVSEIRGVNTSGVLSTLLERHLVKIVGRKRVVGRPFLYATTKEFLIRFGLNDLSDLPKVEDMTEALGLEAPLLVEQALSDDHLPLEEPDEEGDLEPSLPDAQDAEGDRLPVGESDAEEDDGRE